MGLFVDTWGWLQRRDRRESRHEEVPSYFQEALQEPGSICTTDYVHAETLTLLFKCLPCDKAWDGSHQIESARRNDFLDVVWIGRDRFDQAVRLRRRYSDKPGISFTDLTSMIVMQDLDVRDLLAGDAHFAQVGRGFRRQP